MIVLLTLRLTHTRVLGGKQDTLSLLLSDFPLSYCKFPFSSIFPSILPTYVSLPTPPPMFSGKRVKILTVKIKHNKNNNNKKAICCLEGLALAKEIYAFKIIVLAVGLKKSPIWNSKLHGFLCSQLYPYSPCKMTAPVSVGGQRGAIRKNQGLEALKILVCVFLTHNHVWVLA